MAKAKIDEAVFSLCWLTSLAGALAEGHGRIATRSEYAAAPGSAEELALPWSADRRSLSRFWAHYLGAPGKLRRLPADTGWDRMVPFQWDVYTPITGPDGTDAEATVLVYPNAVAVVIEVDARGAWDVGSLPRELNAIAGAREWSVRIGDHESSGRTLSGIASDLRDAALPFVVEPGFDVGPETKLTVAAPLHASGDPAALDLGKPGPQACLAGLASLGPAGAFQADRLLGANSDSNLGARLYVLSSGHSVWHRDQLLQPDVSEGLECLVSNQTSLVVQIAAMSDIVAWAGDRVAERSPIPVELQPLVRTAMLRLEQLHVGERRKTYRSGLSTVRIAPILPKIEAVKAVIGSL